MQLQVGRHTISFEPPWLVNYVVRGALSADEMLRFAAFVDEHASGCSFVLALADLRELGAVPVETRRTAAYSIPRFPYRGMAFHGGSFQARIITKLVLGAARLLARDDQNPVRFFDTEGEARAWLAERARELDRHPR